MSKRLRSVGSASNGQTELRCDCCDMRLREEDLITTFEYGFLHLSCVDCALFAQCEDKHGQMSDTDPLNVFFVQPTKPNNSGERYE